MKQIGLVGWSQGLTSYTVGLIDTSPEDFIGQQGNWDATRSQSRSQPTEDAGIGLSGELPFHSGIMRVGRAKSLTISKSAKHEGCWCGTARMWMGTRRSPGRQGVVQAGDDSMRHWSRQTFLPNLILLIPSLANLRRYCPINPRDIGLLCELYNYYDALNEADHQRLLSCASERAGIL